MKIVLDDPDDDKFLACALASNANYIVSGDQHLLVLSNFCGIPIVTPRQMLNKIRNKGGLTRLSENPA